MTDTGVKEVVARARIAQAEYEKMGRNSVMIARRRLRHGPLWNLPAINGWQNWLWKRQD